MARRIIDIGAVGNDGTGDSIRDSFRKVNENFRELYSSLGLGERLKFITLDDTPETYDGTLDSSQINYTPLVTVNNTEDGLAFKHLRAGNGISIDFEGNPSEITINSDFAEISADPSPQLGGNLSARFGGEQYRILDLGTNSTPITPLYKHEAVNKSYADTKVAKAGINAIDPETGIANIAFGRMTGPLLLSRDPEPDDDILYEGLTAATKRYVDSSAFGSTVNLYVATSGQDARTGVTAALQGRALAYAYRTIEAACKRAEELVLEARDELGPYRKRLTFNGGANDCTLAKIETSPASGTGFIGLIKMSVQTVDINIVGVNYYPGDILEVTGGTVAPGGGKARIEVLSTVSTPGAIATYRIVSSGLYTALPTSTGVSTTIVVNAAPAGILRTNTATFDLTFNVASVAITNGGSGYNLVSVRITGGGGTGAFGTAVVTGGIITSLTITDRGSGFTSLPILAVDLPRFFIRTDGYRTDFSGDYSTTTPETIRGRDIREGLYLQGEDSGALAQIVSHSGALDSNGNEIFDVDVEYGAFIPGETILYGDVSKNIQIAIIVEAGIYEENYPIKVPNNTTLVGDDFRRCQIRPRPGTSSSPWAFMKFRRDVFIGQPNGDYAVFDPIDDEWINEVRSGDLIQIASRLYGYHYLEDSSEPVYPPINNKGEYTAAAALLTLNKSFLSDEITAWMNNNISTATSPSSIWYNFEYNQILCKRDVGLLVDSFVFDLKYGSYNRTISAGLKYYQGPSNLGDPEIAITTQLPQYLQVLTHLESLMQDIIINNPIGTVYNESYLQIIDPAYQAEVGASGVITALLTALTDVIDGSGSVNYPKDNDKLDVFLANDATRWQSISGQGHGGFMMVLDPTGQILAKSPYPQECASFSKSIDRITFAGGMYVDGFAGNLQFRHTASSSGNTVISVSGLDRYPQLPASFIVSDTVYRVNYIRNFVFGALGSTADFILDETAPFNITAGSRTCTISVGSPAVITSVDHRLQSGSILYFSSTGTLPTGISANTEYYVTSDGLTNDTFNITAIYGSTTKINTTGVGTGTFSYQRTYELIMPGNRSMVCNDFTQINDLGYGIVVNNGGLVEAVSMFTYYCHISFYSVNGGQIRSVSSSSAHGNYALVAQGFDPLEVPTPTTIFEDLAQTVYAFCPGGAYTGAAGQLFINVDGFDYAPNSGSELEINHSGVIFRYPVTSAQRDAAFNTVYRLNLTSGSGAVESEGLFDIVADNTKMTLRQSNQVILTGDLVEVAVRPSTGLKLRETETTVYRVLEFASYTDLNGPYEVSITNTSPAVIKMLVTVQTINSDVCTTTQNHKLRIGDKFIPTSTANGFTSGTTYYIISVPNYNQFTVSTSPGGSTATLSNGVALSIKGVKTHKLLENYTISFQSSGGTLPTGFTALQVYYVISSGLTDTEFKISVSKNGIPVNALTAGSGTFQLTHEGLTRTNLRENYDYVELTIWQRGEFTSDYPDGRTCSISVGSPPVVTLASHGFNDGDVIGFSVSLGGAIPLGLSDAAHYLVDNAGLNDFEITQMDGTAITTTSAGSGTFKVGKVTGRVGDDSFRVVPINTDIIGRLNNAKFMWIGEEYVIDTYESESVTNAPYARVILNRPLVDAVNDTNTALTLKAGVPIRSNGSLGTLTIRISLTRVTGHDLLEIGTGSYADTNYPKEIYGTSVNAISEDTEVEERDVGRVFYVTTDQYGNFKVGPYFKVDQGTGQVTFSSSIALSNLDGIGFKRGVPVSEFSTDSGFSDNATDTVPTENATRIYIERRLGISHGGAPVDSNLLIPVNSGGYMSLDGQLSMKASMNLGNNKIINVADPTGPLDALNLRSFNLNNLQGFDISSIQAGDVFVFTGNGATVINATVSGDIRFGSLEPGVDSTLKLVNVQIVDNSIVNTDINSSAAIAQSKLALNTATTRANATGITQADRGIASFDSAIFDITDGWVTVKNNGLTLADLPQLSPDTVIGNSGLSTANASAVSFSTIVDEGLAVKKTMFGQFGTSTGFLRRISAGSADNDFTTVEAAAGSAASPEASKIVIRDSNGDFGARVVDLSQLKVDGAIAIDTSTSATGGTITYSGFNATGGITISTGSLATDKISQYVNDSHRFRNQANSANAPIICSSVETLTLTTGGNTTPGTITGRWTLSGTSPNESRLQATYSADLAENYEGDKEYEVGTVLVFGGDKEVTVTGTQGDTRVAGVVSNTAAFSMYEACPGLKNLVALQGRVPCKVVGKIKKGDILITSKIPGVAIASSGVVLVGTVVGKALQDYDSDHIGKIEIAVGRT